MEIFSFKTKKENQPTPADLAGFYDRYLSDVYNYHFYRTLHCETAEDLTSLTFLKVVENFASFDERKASGKTWVLVIARNTLYDYFRRRKVEVDLDASWDLSDGNQAAELMNLRGDLEELKKQLAKLSPAEQEIIIFRIWDGLSHAEIATILEKSEPACKMAFSRALKKLQEKMPAALALMLISKYLI